MKIYYAGADYEVEVTGFYPGQEAILNRAPEHCQPAEDPEVDFEWKIVDKPDGDEYFTEIDPHSEPGFIDLVIEEYIAEQGEW